MTVQNSEIRDIFEQVADFLEIRGENEFRVRAYREGARIVGGLSENVEDMVREGRDLTRFRGIGKDLAAKIRQIVETGSLEQLEDLRKNMSPGLLEMMEVPGVGPKRVAALYNELGVENVDELEEAASEGRVAELEGFGEKTQQGILEAIREDKKKKQAEGEGRILLADAEPFAKNLREHIAALDKAKDVTVAGSFRRGKETVGDLDILATCKRGGERELMDAFTTHEDVDEVLSQGKTKSSVRLRSGLQVDLRIVPQVSYGAALHYFTGSKAHNIAVRKLAMERGYKVNEYGVHDDDQRIAGKTEKEVYATVDLPYIEPELRENLGEIEAAREGKLPDLVEARDIRGDLHAHTNRTDGRNTLAEMGRAARDLGYEYLAITEHSQKVTMARGLDEKEVRKHLERIDQANDDLDGVTLLKGMEVDILKDGSLDLPDSILKELDFTVCSVHYHQKLPGDRQTERVIKAMDNRYMSILGHPTGRLMGERDAMDIDLDRIIHAAADKDVVIELNSHPERLDLPSNYCKAAAELGVRIAISTDAHSTDNLKLMRLGVTQARRGWLQPGDVVNTRPLKKLLELLKRS
ncbi:MAG: DNA polymerase/3'-5' exonuclease PolX [Desulfatibacillaceae bacterium]